MATAITRWPAAYAWVNFRLELFTGIAGYSHWFMLSRSSGTLFSTRLFLVGL